jgi:hypothetical protein
MAIDLRGRYVIEDNTNPANEGEYDWRLIDPADDPPKSQFQLAESARDTYNQNIEYVDDETKYIEFRSRIREIIRLGVCENPIDKNMPKRLDQLNTDILSYFQRAQTPKIAHEAKLRLTIAACVCAVGVMLQWFSSEKSQVIRFSDWLLFTSAASAALAFVVWTDSLKSFDDGPKLATKLSVPVLDFAISLVIILAAGSIFEAKYLSIQLSGAAVGVTAGPANAMALGFLLGLLNERLMDSVFRPIIAKLTKDPDRKPVGQSKQTAMTSTAGRTRL